jgi:hypothetical protein
MPLKQSRIWHLLKEKRSHFETFDKSALQSLNQYRVALADVSQEPNQAIQERLSEFESLDRGAEPIEPLGSDPNWVKPCGLVWQNREESFAWVRDRLTDVSTFAVDGSQIYPGKDLSIPVALVQIGWFENLHSATAHYEKDVDVDIMTPFDLKATSSGEPVDRRVNMRRFQMETERLIQYMDDHSNTGNCLAFFDGSLVVTFAEAFDETTRNFYVECVVELLKASQHYQVPLVSYIDTTYARDLIVMLQRLETLPEAPSLHDAPLLNKLMQWGDRTPFFRCRRSGVLKYYPATVRDQVLFTYLKAHEGFPIRLELPLWVYEAGMADTVMDWVRGEIIIGGGYPYVIETADQTAVLKADDRQLFFKLLQDWADTEALNLRLSRKMVSKARRR